MKKPLMTVGLEEIEESSISTSYNITVIYSFRKDTNG